MTGPDRTLDEDAPRDSRDVANITPTVARAVLGLVEHRNHSPERLCRGLGFTYEDLTRHELLLSHRQMRELILRAQVLLREPALGLAVGARQTPVSWGLPGLAMLTCETFGAAIGYGIEHQGAAGALMDHLVEEHGREVRVEVMPRRFDLQIETFLVEEALASALAVSRCLVGEALDPLRVDLACPRPENESVYRRFFRCPVRFDAGTNRMTFEAHWLGAKLPGYERITCGLVQTQLNTILARPVGRHDLLETVSNRMRFDIDRSPDQRQLARQINVSDRTLRRRLGQKDTSYREIRDTARFEKARDLLLHSGMTIEQVADSVGYSDARAFRRAFKRWSGQLPNAFRAAGRPGSDGAYPAG